jgi:hypothetical protein
MVTPAFVTSGLQRGTGNRRNIAQNKIGAMTCPHRKVGGRSRTGSKPHHYKCHKSTCGSQNEKVGGFFFGLHPFDQTHLLRFIALTAVKHED